MPAIAWGVRDVFVFVWSGVPICCATISSDVETDIAEGELERIVHAQRRHR